MAKEAERLLAGTRWVPEPLRTPDADREPDVQVEGGAEGLPAFLGDGDNEDADEQAASDDPEEPQRHPIAAE
jgi:ParB family chromosome partitioning protein